MFVNLGFTLCFCFLPCVMLCSMGIFHATQRQWCYVQNLSKLRKWGSGLEKVLGTPGLMYYTIKSDSLSDETTKAKAPCHSM